MIYGSRARSVPEYLKLRFDEKPRGFNAVTFAMMTVFSSGISMYVMGALLALLLGWNIHACIAASATVVLVYIALGGLTSAIYNEVLQFFLIVFGFTPVAYLGLRDAGGWSGLAARVPETFVHSWKYLGRADSNPMGVEWFGMVMTGNKPLHDRCGLFPVTCPHTCRPATQADRRPLAGGGDAISFLRVLRVLGGLKRLGMLAGTASLRS